MIQIIHGIRNNLAGINTVDERLTKNGRTRMSAQKTRQHGSKAQSSLIR